MIIHDDVVCWLKDHYYISQNLFLVHIKFKLLFFTQHSETISCFHATIIGDGKCSVLHLFFSQGSFGLVGNGTQDTRSTKKLWAWSVFDNIYISFTSWSYSYQFKRTSHTPNYSYINKISVAGTEIWITPKTSCYLVLYYIAWVTVVIFTYSISRKCSFQYIRTPPLMQLTSW